MESIEKHSSNVAAVEDIQQRLVTAGFMDESEVDADFGDKTAEALRAFCRANGLPETDVVDAKLWATLVDASFCMGDRSLYLRMPYFHGADVRALQQALAALGFACGEIDGIFGAYTELALRKFQTNMGIYSDGIAGSQTWATLQRLHHSWEGKTTAVAEGYSGFARAAGVLERVAVCLYGTQRFTRDVASRMSNLAAATNPSSHMISAEALLVPPSDDMLMLHIVMPSEETPKSIPRVLYSAGADFAVRMRAALDAAQRKQPRVVVELPGETWEESGAERSAQHYAITLLDCLCAALADE